MSEVFDCSTEQGRAVGVEAAADAVRRGEIVVLPTDTVYGVGADAFDAVAVAAVRSAKGRGPDMPPPVLVPSIRTVGGLADSSLQGYASELIDRFWPGPLTVVVRAQPSLVWDLGETNGTVALRMPQDPTALALLDAVGPMAVTSANITGMPAATTVAASREQLGESVAVYLDGGPSPSVAPSTILDCTTDTPFLLRAGALDADTLRVALGDVELRE